MGKFKDMFKSLRIRDGLTQDELADKLNISRSAVSAYERGVREPELEILETIADFFNVDMNYLTGNKTEPEEYYIDLQSRQIAQEIFENKELRALFDTGRKAKAEDLIFVHEMLKRMKKEEEQ